VPGRSRPDIEEDDMYPIIQAVGEARLKEMQEQAATHRLVRAARRASRQNAAAGTGRRRRPGFSRWAWRATTAAAAQRVPDDATPDQWASALSTLPADELAGVAAGREPVGRRGA
jgi:hypothetical protein